MKRYSSYLILIGFLLSLSCSKDFLEREPLDELSPSYYFRTANDLKLFANIFYPLLPAHSGYGGGTFWVEKNSDNLVAGSIDLRLSGTRTIPSNGGGWDWSEIRQSNYFLEHCNTAADDPENIKVYIAEVKFFKAMLYFDKVRTFGDVPWINRSMDTESPELYAPRDIRNVVVDSMYYTA